MIRTPSFSSRAPVYPVKPHYTMGIKGLDLAFPEAESSRKVEWAILFVSTALSGSWGERMRSNLHVSIVRQPTNTATATA